MKKSPPRYRHTTPQMSRTQPVFAICPDCGHDVLSALFDATPRFWDRAVLSPLGELHAHVWGLETFWVFESSVYRRDAHAIKSSPTGRGGRIFREHRCGTAAVKDSAKNLSAAAYEGPGF